MQEKRYVREQKISQVADIPVKTLRNERYLRKGFPFIKRGRSIFYDLDVFGAQVTFAIVIKKPSFGLARRVNLWVEIVKNGGALQRLVANKYIGEKKKDLFG